VALRELEQLLPENVGTLYHAGLKGSWWKRRGYGVVLGGALDGRAPGRAGARANPLYLSAQPF